MPALLISSCALWSFSLRPRCVCDSAPKARSSVLEAKFTFDHVPTPVSPQRERSVTDGGHAFFNEIPFNFPKPQRRKKEAVSRLNFGGFVIIRYRPRRYGGRLVRFSQPTFRPRRSQASPPQSSCSHQRCSLLVSPFQFTFGSSHDVTPVVTDLLRRLAFHLSRWERATTEDALRFGRSL